MPDRNCRGDLDRYEFKQKDELLRAILEKKSMVFCEYLAQEDRLLVYDDTLTVKREIPDYLNYLKSGSSVHPEDRRKILEFYQGKARGEVEVRLVDTDRVSKLSLQALPMAGEDPGRRLPVIVQDVTEEKHRQDLLEQRAQRDFPDHAL